MSYKIVIFSTTKALTKSIKKILCKNNYKNIELFETTRSDAYYIATKKILEGARVIVSRGGTTNYLRQRLNIPVVDIRHNLFDISNSLSISKENNKSKIAFIGFSDLCENANFYKDMFNENFNVIEVSNDEDFEIKVKECIKKGITTFVGGIQLENCCKNLNVEYISGDSDELSIQRAIEEAMFDLKLEDENLKIKDLYTMALNNISLGIIACNKNEDVLIINDFAKVIAPTKEDINKLLNIFKNLKSNNTIFKFKGKNFIVNKIFYGNDYFIYIFNNSSLKNKNLNFSDINYVNKGFYSKYKFDDIKGESKKIKELISLAKKYSITESTILITGETGTGKELFAQSIHNHSKRFNKPFVAINCAALPENILESELFGYVKGAFTGANNEGKKGIFELGDGGTVFLDEVSEIPLKIQAKLLRTIQEKEIIRLGDNEIKSIDVRIIASSNRNLEDEVKNKTFREDLFYRLNVLNINVPPLRERKEDIPILFLEILNKKTSNRINLKFSTKAINFLINQDYPGNIRQLENIVERLIAFNSSEFIDYETISKLISPNITTKKIDNFDLDNLSLNEIEILAIKNALKRFNYNKTLVCQHLGISYSTLWRKIKFMEGFNDEDML